ncbi:TetR/AcrR family transcriptional regulator [Nonomuraea zeae]|uniref:TetR/AcrR family transcriptional regulator n=1 Tax=Nonomuraea zeae TaxID=1642303 RepID=A0A5S4GZL8_9ACTN|nr:TetR/AcrR family transcriptional regulator [Nonomuraea zeae]TMR38239.1 TetR/AcrR family transcriptional regulator [Nonomuraea zeae]
MKTSRRGGYAVGTARRAKIVELAARRFAEAGGYHSTSMAQIAADAGLSEGGLLHHFPSKKHLLLAVAEHRLAGDATWWAGLPAEATGLDVLHAMVETTERHLAQPGLIELFVLISAEAVDRAGPAQALFAERYEQAVAEITRRLRDGARSGHFREDVDFASVAREYIAASDGLQLQWVISGGTLDLAGAVRAHLDRLARSITVDGRGLGRG